MTNALKLKRRNLTGSAGLRLALALAVGCGGSLAQEVRLTGEVRDERLRPIYGALVSVSLIPSPGARVVPFNLVVRSGADGSFSAAAPPGDYEVCAYLPNSELLNGCLWGAEGNKMSLTAGQKVLPRMITLSRGYPFEVILQDKGKLMNQAGGKKSAPVLIGLKGKDGAYVPFVPKKNANDEQVFRALVPRDADLQLSLTSASFKLADEKGAAIDTKRGKSMTIRYTGNEGERSVKFQVTGKEVDNK